MQSEMAGEAAEIIVEDNSPSCLMNLLNLLDLVNVTQCEYLGKC